MDTNPISAIHLNDVSKSFGSVQAVNGLDLDVRPGEVVAFLGPNGAGKTTTIDMILGLSQPTSGEVEVYGMTPRAAIGRGLVSAVMQTGGLLPDISVRETVELTASLFVHSRTVDESLQRAGIADIADRQVSTCSGGQQQRLRFAMALVSDPALIILDEPTTGMDVEGRRSFWTAIHDDAQRGRTVLFATHYLEEADTYADRIVLVRKGKVVADGTAAQIRSLVSGRTLRATLSDESRSAAVVAAVRTLPTVTEASVLGRTLTVHADDTDSVAAHLLTSRDAHDLQITSTGLEDAFLALTADDAETDCDDACEAADHSVPALAH